MSLNIIRLGLESNSIDTTVWFGRFMWLIN